MTDRSGVRAYPAGGEGLAGNIALRQRVEPFPTCLCCVRFAVRGGLWQVAWRVRGGGGACWGSSVSWAGCSPVRRAAVLPVPGPVAG